MVCSDTKGSHCKGPTFEFPTKVVAGFSQIKPLYGGAYRHERRLEKALATSQNSCNRLLLLLLFYDKTQANRRKKLEKNVLHTLQSTSIIHQILTHSLILKSRQLIPTPDFNYLTLKNLMYSYYPNIYSMEFKNVLFQFISFTNSVFYATIIPWDTYMFLDFQTNFRTALLELSGTRGSWFRKENLK